MHRPYRWFERWAKIILVDTSLPTAVNWVFQNTYTCSEIHEKTKTKWCYAPPIQMKPILEISLPNDIAFFQNSFFVAGKSFVIPHINTGISVWLGWAWTSPTLVWLHCTPCVCMFACLLAWTDHLLNQQFNFFMCSAISNSGSYFARFASIMS